MTKLCSKPLWACILAALLIASCSAKVASKHGKGQKLASTLPESIRYHPNHQAAPARKEADMPAEFDWCKLGFCTSGWNQHIPSYCGSCYLHASLSMLNDRIKIAKQGHSPDVMLGRQSFLNCGPSEGYSGGCDGGDVIDVVRYMAQHGLPDESCMPYSATDLSSRGLQKHKGEHCRAQDFCLNCMPGDDQEGGQGETKCWAVREPILYKLSSYGNVGATQPDAGNMEAMMSEILARGPITCSIACPDELVYGYDGGIYEDTTGDTEVDHDVEVVGWGEENGVKFWNIRNSWGSYWGVNGFFRLRRGVNALQLEAGDCWYAVPTWDMEKDVAEGRLVGSMYGVHPRGTPVPDFQALPTEHNAQQVIEEQQQQQQQNVKHSQQRE
mmetsp:Transcript_8366/g.20755  ORF Transcript_8366/g.20755 Transcript_8366/m.20755 type:complete len:384 (+) Transcript_8366:44-1195(+)